MASFSAWLGQGNSAISAGDRASDAWGRIQRNPTSVTLVRAGVSLDAQTVRIEFDNSSSSGSEVQGEGAGRSGRRYAIISGVKNHATVDDTDIQRGDRLAINGQQYRVLEIVTPPGEVQATIEVTS